MASPGCPTRVATPSPARPATKVLLVDDEAEGRRILSSQLEEQGLVVHEAGDAASGIAALREVRPDVVLLDRRLRQTQGEPALQAFRKAAPRIPLIVLTGHAGIDSLAPNGRGEVFAYVEKPCDPKALGEAIARAVHERQQRISPTAMGQRTTPLRWLWGRVGFRPGVLMLGVLCVVLAAVAPAPSGLLLSLSSSRQAAAMVDRSVPTVPQAQPRARDLIAPAAVASAESQPGSATDLSAAARSAMAMLGILGMAVLFWATRALPTSVTGMAVAFLLYAFGIFPSARVAQAFVSDPVLLLAAVSVIAAAAAGTGLYRRLALAIFATTKSPLGFALVGLPVLALVSSVLPGWAVVAFAIPVLAAVHRESAAVRAGAGRRPVVLGCMLALTFAANAGAFGSPAGSGRNAALLAMLGDVQRSIGFADWLASAVPVVLISAWLVGGYWLVVLRNPARDWNAAAPVIARTARTRTSPWSAGESSTVIVLAAMVALWMAQARWAPLRGWGLAGPALLGVVALVVLRVLDAKTLSSVPWATVVSFASACAVAKGLFATGVATWLGSDLARGIARAAPPGLGLLVAVLVAGSVAGSALGEVAAVVLVGPLALAASTALGMDPARPVLAVALALSTANSVTIATPSNAVASALAKDVETGEPMIRPRDMLVHGTAVTVLTIGVLSAWAWMRGGGWMLW